MYISMLMHQSILKQCRQDTFASCLCAGWGTRAAEQGGTRRAITPLNISDEGAKPPNISEDGAKIGLEFVRGVKIHPLSFYLTN